VRQRSHRDRLRRDARQRRHPLQQRRHAEHQRRPRPADDIDDSADTNPVTATLTSTTLVGLLPTAIHFDNGNPPGALVINGGSGGNTFLVLSTPTLPNDGTISINTGSGSDTVFVQPTSAVLAVIGGGNPGDAIYLYTAASGTHVFDAEPVGDSSLDSIVAVGFGVVVAVGNPGGTNTAFLTGQGSGVNLYAAGTFPEANTGRTVPYAYFAGPSFLSYVVDFQKVSGDVVSGGTNSAVLFDAPGGGNVLNADTTSVSLSRGSLYNNIANGFRWSRPSPRQATTTSANFNGDPQAANAFVAAPTFAYMTHAAATDYLNVAIGFRSVTGNAATSGDTAQMFGSAAGSSTFMATTNVSSSTAATTAPASRTSSPPRASTW